MKKRTKITSIFIMLLFVIAVSVDVQYSYAQSKPQLNDAQIAMVAVLGNKIDIKYAKIAKKKSDNLSINGFANTMIDNHSSVVKAATKLAKKLGVTPQSSDLSKKLKANAKKERANLRSKSGMAFNKAYIDNEVAFHKAVINLVKHTLIPEATNDQLKNLLKKAAPMFKGHLQYAESLQQSLGS
jgi:putative membrane protein